MLSVVFDMDGVIFDTETICLRSWLSLEKAFKAVNIEETFQKCIGCNKERTKRQLFKDQGENFPVEEFLQAASREFHQIVKIEGLPMKKGAEELLRWLKERRSKIGLASSTRIETVKKELEMAGLLPFFDVIVGGDMVEKSKPEPDIYLEACRLLQVDPKSAFAIEDSYNGVCSAKKAGMKVLMVPDRLPPTKQMYDMTYCIIKDLSLVCDFFKTNRQIEDF